MGARVSVVLITFDSARFLRRCAAGDAAQTHPDLELIVVDNASGDGSRDLLRERFPEARFIANPSNLGFSAAANQGIAAASGEYVLLLNPDVFMQPDYVANLVSSIETAGHAYGAATGKLLRGRGDDIEPTELVDSKGIVMTRSGRHFDIDAGTRDVSGEETHEVFGVSGAAALHRRAMLDDVKISGEAFDEDFFAYREDADLAWRARLFGWRALYVPSARAYHVRRVTPEVRSALPPEINRHSVKNRFLLRLKNQGMRLAIRDAIFTVPRDLVVLAAALTVERSSFPAFLWLWRNRARVRAKRREIQRRRVVSDRELGKWFV